MKKILPSLILLGLLIATVFIAQHFLIKKQLAKLYTLPEFSYFSHHETDFFNGQLTGKVSVANFIFTKCPGICPVMTRRMHELYSEFETEDRVQFVSFSVDPERDSLQALQYYAKKWEVKDRRWHFLRTDSTIQSLYEQGFKLGGELPYGHSGAFVLIDNNAVLRGYYHYDDEAELALLRDDIQLIIDEF